MQIYSKTLCIYRINRMQAEKQRKTELMHVSSFRCKCILNITNSRNVVVKPENNWCLFYLWII